MKELARFNALIRKLRQVRGGEGPHKAVDEMVGDADRDFFAAMHDDLNVPKAKACLFELLKRINKHMDLCPFSRSDAQLALDLLWRADRILCVLDFGQDMLVADHINLLIEERSQARASGDFSRADGLRQELEAQGVEIQACTTCLQYFDLEDKLAVGRPTTMLKSINLMLGYEVVSL